MPAQDAFGEDRDGGGREDAVGDRDAAADDFFVERDDGRLDRAVEHESLHLNVLALPEPVVGKTEEVWL